MENKGLEIYAWVINPLAFKVNGNCFGSIYEGSIYEGFVYNIQKIKSDKIFP